EADAVLAFQRLAGVLLALGNAHGVDEDEARLGLRIGRHGAQVGVGNAAHAAALHLLVIAFALHVTHEDQHFHRLYVGAGGDHVHGHRHARERVDTEGLDQRLGVFAAVAVGDFLGKVVAFAEHLTHGVHDLL